MGKIGKMITTMKRLDALRKQSAELVEEINRIEAEEAKQAKKKLKVKIIEECEEIDEESEEIEEESEEESVEEVKVPKKKKERRNKRGRPRKVRDPGDEDLPAEEWKNKIQEDLRQYNIIQMRVRRARATIPFIDEHTLPIYKQFKAVYKNLYHKRKELNAEFIMQLLKAP